jgi:hypothetical protein
MNHNGHAIDYYARLYWSLEEQGRYWAMAVVYQLHLNELKAGGFVMSTTRLQALVRQILDIAMRIAEQDGPAVSVEFNSHSNHLRVTAKSKWWAPLTMHECIDLYGPSATLFEQKAIDERLQKVLTQLNALLVGCTPTPSPAA